MKKRLKFLAHDIFKNSARRLQNVNITIVYIYVMYVFPLLVFDYRFLVVLVCLIFSVLSTIDTYASSANETLFWMVNIYFLTLTRPGVFSRISVYVFIVF